MIRKNSDKKEIVPVDRLQKVGETILKTNLSSVSISNDFFKQPLGSIFEKLKIGNIAEKNDIESEYISTYLESLTKYHDGGIVQSESIDNSLREVLKLKSDEVPAVLQTNEMVLTRQEVKNYLGKTSVVSNGNFKEYKDLSEIYCDSNWKKTSNNDVKDSKNNLSHFFISNVVSLLDKLFNTIEFNSIKSMPLLIDDQYSKNIGNVEKDSIGFTASLMNYYQLQRRDNNEPKLMFSSKTSSANNFYNVHNIDKNNEKFFDSNKLVQAYRTQVINKLLNTCSKNNALNLTSSLMDYGSKHSNKDKKYSVFYSRLLSQTDTIGKIEKFFNAYPNISAIKVDSLVPNFEFIYNLSNDENSLKNKLTFPVSKFSVDRLNSRFELKKSNESKNRLVQHMVKSAEPLTEWYLLKNNSSLSVSEKGDVFKANHKNNVTFSTLFKENSYIELISNPNEFSDKLETDKIVLNYAGDKKHSKEKSIPLFNNNNNAINFINNTEAIHDRELPHSLLQQLFHDDIGYQDLPKYHTGGIINSLQSDEQFAILQRGEGVFTPEQMQHGTHIINELSQMNSTQQQEQVNVTQNLQNSIQLLKEKLDTIVNKVEKIPNVPMQLDEQPSSIKNNRNDGMLYDQLL